MVNDILLHKWIHGQLSDEELETFKARPEYLSLVELYSQTQNLKTTGFEKEKVYKSIIHQKKSIAKQQSNKNNNSGRILSFLKYGLVACLLGGIALFFLPNEQFVEYQLGNIETLALLLPDQSSVTLNAQSKFSYNQKKWNENRTVSLEGEAFFDVVKGSTFLVNTRNGDIQVLGTQFNVKSRFNKLYVHCEEGKVQVFNRDQTHSEIISINEALRVNEDGTIVRFKENKKESWIKGISRLKDVSLEEAIHELEIQFDINIICENIDKKTKLTSQFNHDNLERALETVTIPLSLKYKVENNKTVILSNK